MATSRAAARGEAALDRAALRIERFRFACRARDEIHLRAYGGSALRGVLGHALKRAVCVVRVPTCPSCLLYRSCVYSYVFETPPPAGAQRLRKYPAAPHPFVVAPGFAPGRAVAAGAPFDVDVTLVGRAVDHAPYVAHAFRAAGADGLGPRRGRFEVERIDQCVDHGDDRWTPVWRGGVFAPPQRTAIPPPPPIAARGVTLRFETPLRLQRDDRPVGPDELAFHDLFRQLLRRISLLAYFHGGTPLQTDFAHLSRSSRDVEIRRRDLRWCDWSRQSSRQQRRVPMGGVLGRIAVDGAALAPYWPYLWFGQWTHAGKGASMGLGRYRAAAGESAPTADTTA